MLHDGQSGGPKQVVSRGYGRRDDVITKLCLKPRDLWCWLNVFGIDLLELINVIEDRGELRGEAFHLAFAEGEPRELCNVPDFVCRKLWHVGG